MLVSRAERAEYEGDELPDCACDEYPAEALSMEDCEAYVCECEEAEEEGEDYGGGEGGVVLVERVAGVGWDVAVGIGDGSDACGCGWSAGGGC